MDLFEDIRAMLGCEYISDIVSSIYIDRARKLMETIDLTKYSERDIADMEEYLYGKKRRMEMPEV